MKKILIHKDSKLKNVSGNVFKEKIYCSERIDDCKKNDALNILEYTTVFGDCFLKNYEFSYIVGNKVLNDRKYLFTNNDLTQGIKKKFY